MELDVRLPYLCLWVDGYFATIHEDGSVEFYCDGDIRVPLAVLKQFIFKADRFMFVRENNGNKVC